MIPCLYVGPQLTRIITTHHRHGLLLVRCFIYIQAVAFLESDELEKEVNTMCDDARSRGITGVPMTIIDGKWAVSGVQSADVFTQVRSAFPCYSPPLTLRLPPG